MSIFKNLNLKLWIEWLLFLEMWNYLISLKPLRSSRFILYSKGIAYEVVQPILHSIQCGLILLIYLGMPKSVSSQLAFLQLHKNFGKCQILAYEIQLRLYAHKDKPASNGAWFETLHTKMMWRNIFRCSIIDKFSWVMKLAYYFWRLKQ
jgi:hypothetical protein